jgi:ABC-type uncharacterized transport system auxiliary subunit
MRIVWLLMCLSLTACSGSFLQSTEPKPTVYTLRPVAEARTAADAGAARIVEVMKPSVPPGFETDRIALYTEGGQKLDYYAGASWPDMMDDVFQQTAMRSLRNALPYTVAVAPEERMDADYRLRMKIDEFQPVYSGAAEGTPELRASFEFTLIRLPEEKIVRSFILRRDMKADGAGMDSILAGLEKMAQDMFSEAYGRLDSNLRLTERRE